MLPSLKKLLIALCLLGCVSHIEASDDWTCSVCLSAYTSLETNGAPRAFLWLPGKTERIRFAVLAQQNMTEEALLRNRQFRENMAQLGGALIWVSPWFSQDWNPQTQCQALFEGMMNQLAQACGRPEMRTVPIVPFGHSAQATFPWNFAAWNPNRTLCIISFHGDAPRTNLCGYGRSNVEWGRNRHINGIPGLMVEGEYEWWEARVRPAQAFRLMYPESCLSFLCDTGSGHFDLSDETIHYLSLFIRKAAEQRLRSDGTLQRLAPENGWLAGPFVPDLPASDGTDKGKPVSGMARLWQPTAAPWADYAADPHLAFWYPDREMAELTETRYRSTLGKQPQFVGIRYNGKLIPYNEKLQGGLELDLRGLAPGERFALEAVYTDSARVAILPSHHRGLLHVDYICGPIRKNNDATFERIPYDGTPEHSRARSAWVVAVGESRGGYKRTVQPLRLLLE